MRAQKREEANWGFRVPTEGWHVVTISEGIDITVNEKSGKQSLMIPAVIAEGSEDDGIKVTIFCPYKDASGDLSAFGEQKAADVLNAVGLFDKFEEAFPGDISLFDPEVIEAIKLKLPGTFCKMDIQINDKYANIMGVTKVNADTSDKKSKGKSAAKTEATGQKAGSTSKKSLDW